MSTSQVCFIRQNNSTQLLEKTFQEAEKLDESCTWMSEEECMAIKERHRKSVYIFEHFEGEAFENVMKTGNRIYGPSVILTCVKEGLALPKMSHPVHNLAMKDHIVSCTSLEKAFREPLHQLIQWMCGEVSKDFHDSVTHLIAGEVGSQKYLVAGSLKKKIMTPEWVQKVWEDSQSSYVKADDKIYLSYRCPVFAGCVITVSGLDNDERAEVRDLIEREGGRYSGEMKINECTHLVVNAPRGQKYEFARKWKIHIVSSAWPYDSVEAGYCLDPCQYKVKENSGGIKERPSVTSTPTADISHMSHGPDVSCISVTHINETAFNTTTGPRPGNRPRPSIGSGGASPAQLDPLDTLDVASVRSGLFLDGCKLFLSGFSGTRLEKLRRIINLGGGTRFSKINESISHVVMGTTVDADVKLLQEGHFRPHVVSVAWVVACASEQTQVPEEPYLCLELPGQEPTTPLPKKKKSLNAKTVTNTPVMKPADLDQTVEPDDMEDLLSQYMPGNTDTTDESALLRAVEAAEKAPPPEENETTMEDVTMQEENQDEGGLFVGKRFILAGLPIEQEEELGVCIKEAGGKLLKVTSRAVPDYAVVPVFNCPVTITASEVVTVAYIQMCLEKDSVLPVGDSPFFTPMTLLQDSMPLEGCVLSLSTYSGVERDVLMHMAELMGAKCQEYFVKQGNRGLSASTHLIVSQPSGSKYQAAKKWKLPAVRKSWLFECARTGKRVPEDKHSVDLPEEEEQVNTSSSLPAPHTPRQIGNTTSTVQQAGNMGNTPQQAAITGNTPRHAESTVSTPRQAGNTPRHAETSVRTPWQARDTGNTPRQPENTDSTPQHRGKMAKTPDKDEVDASPSESKENVVSAAINAEENRKVFPIQQKSIESDNDTSRLPNQRVKQLIDQTKQETPRRQKAENAGVDTPGKFLKPGVSYKPQFDLQDFMSALDTPEALRKKHQRRSSLPLDELLSKNMAIALKNTAVPQKLPGTPAPKKRDVNESFFKEGPTGPLRGVVISVSKKLSAQQSDINNMASELGADYRWTYDQACTHFIFQGRHNDTSKEFRIAREHGKTIISPHWITVCYEQKAHVDESLFPHDYNPNLSLAVTSSKKETPRRQSTRRATRAHQKAEDTSVSPLLTRQMRTKAKVAEEVVAVVKLEKKTPSPMVVKKEYSPVKVAEKVELAEDVTDGHDGFDDQNTCSDEGMVAACEDLEERGVIKVVKPSQPPNTLAREAFVDDITNIMAATKQSAPGKRRNRRTDSLSGEISEEPEAKRTSLTRLNIRAEDSDVSRPSSKDRRATRGSLRSRAAKRNEISTEPSQMVEVTWDDPQARQQQEKLAAELAKNSEPFSPQRGAASSGEDPDRTVNEDDLVAAQPDTAEKPEAVKQRSHITPSKAENTEAKEAPSPHVDKHGDTTIEDPSAEDMDVTVDEQTTRVFLFSGLAAEERADYGAIVERLGGQVSEAAYYDSSCTHLVVGCPTRNEKYLSCMASGKWVLHKSYIEACKEQQHFVDEAQHEWGGEGTRAILEGLPPYVGKLGRAAHRWRNQLKKGKGAFFGWRCLLVTDRRREDGLKRLLVAGGANVVATRPPFPSLKDVNFAFMDLAKVTRKVDVDELVAAGVECVKPDYISAFLMEEETPSTHVYSIMDASSMPGTSSSDSSRKRKPSEVETPSSKRSRLQ